MGIEKQFETGQAPNLIIDQVRGNIMLSSWDESRVVVNAKGDRYRFMQEGNDIRLEGFEDCRLVVPVGASLTIGDIHGNAQIVGIRGQVNVQQVHGNLRGDELGPTRVGRSGGEFVLRDVAGHLVVGNVGGNFHASEVNGNVQLEQCGGNCSVREISGQITLGRVRGNLNSQTIDTLKVDSVSGNASIREGKAKVEIQKVGGNLVILESVGDVQADWVGGEVKMRESTGGLKAKAGGHANLNLLEVTAPKVSVQVGGDIRCRVPLNVNAKVGLRAGNGLVIKNLELPNQWDPRQMDFVLGNGEGQLQLEAGNRIKLVGATEEESSPDWDMDFDFQFQGDFNERATELVQQVADQVEAQVEAFTRTLNERLSQLDSGDDIAAKVQTKVQSAIRQAEEKIAEAMRHAERQAGRQAERGAARDDRRRMRYERGMPPMPPMPPAPPMGGPGTP